MLPGCHSLYSIIIRSVIARKEVWSTLPKQGDWSKAQASSPNCTLLHHVLYHSLYMKGREHELIVNTYTGTNN